MNPRTLVLIIHAVVRGATPVFIYLFLPRLQLSGEEARRGQQISCGAGKRHQATRRECKSQKGWGKKKSNGTSSKQIEDEKFSPLMSLIIRQTLRDGRRRGVRCCTTARRSPHNNITKTNYYKIIFKNNNKNYYLLYYCTPSF